MAHSTKLGWTAGSVAVALLLSLALHGLLLLALWCWPMQPHSPALSIETTRILVDTCALDSPSPTLVPETELPAELLGPAVNAALAPRLDGPLPTRERPAPPSVPAPTSRTGNGSGKESISQDDSLFPLPARAASVVYVLDRSLSMGTDRKLDFARRELIASLRRLPPTVRFQVIDYNDYVELLRVDGRGDLLPAQPAVVARAIAQLQTLEAAGNTNHLAALRCGLDLRPDVLYFLTDADDLRPEEIAAVSRRNRGSVIHTIELTHRRMWCPEGPLAQLARDNHGSSRRVSVASD